MIGSSGRCRVLVAYTELSHYRLPLFARLGRRYDLTVLHSGAQLAGPHAPYRELVCPVARCRGLSWQPRLLREVRSGAYDVAVLFLDVRWPATVASALSCPSPTKLITWGAWLTDSRLANWARHVLIERSHASLFYGAAARDAFRRRGCRGRLLVAHNTYDVDDSARAFESPVRDCLLCVGALQQRKEHERVIEAFAAILPRISSDIALVFVGAGPERRRLGALAESRAVAHRVKFVGEVTDGEALKAFYARAIASVSFGQAGLSVLQSLGHGVPFVTKRGAISGGEIDNVRPGYTGWLCDDDPASLAATLERLCTDDAHARQLGRQAWEYYQQYATMDNMAQGFVDAIEDTDHARVAPMGVP